MINLRLPSITGTSEKEQLSQMRSYLHQLVGDLQWALQNVNTSNAETVTPVVKSVITSGGNSPRNSDDPQSTFESIKALIIKSADIVDAYYEEINKRLEGVYVAESDFGTFKELTEQYIESTSTNIEQSYTNIQQIVSADLGVMENNVQSLTNEVDGLDTSFKDMKSEVEDDLKILKSGVDSVIYSLAEVSANIKSGLLYYDENEIPVYGIEIGQRTMLDGVEVFDKFARFTSDRLSFYDQNDNEVAYISDRKLFINNVEILSTLRMGGFVRTVLADGSIVKRWVAKGGEG